MPKDFFESYGNLLSSDLYPAKIVYDAYGCDFNDCKDTALISVKEDSEDSRAYRVKKDWLEEIKTDPVSAEELIKTNFATPRFSENMIYTHSDMIECVGFAEENQRNRNRPDKTFSEVWEKPPDHRGWAASRDQAEIWWNKSEKNRGH